ncbi:MAG TPA: ion transporter [Parachlamydiaceae bacterium]|nr:ion transporter [Nitrosopumilus sp.]HEV8052704.1 ion transporter [Parachlamydiaceae bacterium]
MRNKYDKEKLDQERLEILFMWNQWFEIPLIILGFCWLVLIIIELSVGLSPFLENLSFTIWVIFILDFIVRFSLAPFKIKYLKSEWITLFALVVPAFRVFKSFQLLRVTKSIYLVKVAASIRRGMQILGSVFGRHGFGYIIGLTFLVILLGAAGIQSLENKFENYGDALWWTAMMITTMGTDFWPETPEGRILCLGISIYAFAIFGYITATVASFLIEKDKNNAMDYKKLLEVLEEIKIDIKSLNK